ncbi:MAG TPA: class I SAM-dependent methyltransferase [Bryobacteraceae bacterium]|nr:class I SAM-dependent methyltransferase [Bryobacteraceae bacterium]
MMTTTWQPEGNYYNKYESSNPVARRMMQGFLRAFDELSAAAQVATVYEVGCGEGHLSFRLARRGAEVRASDVSERLIEEANRKAAAERLRARFDCASVYNLTAAEGAELVVCCEVMEHLEQPEEALDVLAGLARPYLLTSVPREPLWRILNMVRGSYWRQWGNTPGHVQHWTSSGFLRFLGRRFDVVEMRQPLPWTMALCKVRTGAATRTAPQRERVAS